MADNKEPTIKADEISSTTDISGLNLNFPPVNDLDIKKVQADVNSALAKYSQKLTDIQEKVGSTFEEYLSKQKELSEQKKGLISGFVSGIKTLTKERPSAQELFTQELEKFGVTPELFREQRAVIAELKSYADEMAAIEQKYNERELEIEQRAVAEPTMNARINALKRQKAIELSAVASKAAARQAYLNALEGNINQARVLANQVVNLALTDYQQRVNDFKYFDSFAEEDRKIIEEQFEYNQELLRQKKEEMEKKMDLIIDAAKEGINLNIDPVEASLEDVLNAYKSGVSRVVAEEKLVEEEEERKEVLSNLAEDVTYAVEKLLAGRGLRPQQLPELDNIERMEIFNEAFDTLRVFYPPTKVSDKMLARLLNTELGLKPSTPTRKSPEKVEKLSNQEIAQDWLIDFLEGETGGETTVAFK